MYMCSAGVFRHALLAHAYPQDPPASYPLLSLPPTTEIEMPERETQGQQRTDIREAAALAQDTSQGEGENTSGMLVLVGLFCLIIGLF